MVKNFINYINENSKQILVISLVVNLILVIFLARGMFSSGIAIQDIKGLSDNKQFFTEADISNNQLVIEVLGQVKNPGIYIISTPVMILEAINLAGGITTSADLDYIHKNISLSKIIQNKEKIYIPGVLKNLLSTSSENESYLININTGTKDELDTLPGIGEVLAQRIIDNRPYTNPGDLMQIEGISENLYNKLATLITL